jgi:signal peptidase II
MSPKNRLFLGALLLAVPLDQLTKWWISRTLGYADEIPVIDGFFHITHVRNPGAAFGILATSPEPVRIFFFIGVTLVAIALILSFFHKLAPGDRFSALSLGLILAGAIGNLIDRLRFGEVVDFLHFRLWGGYTWPDFNLADSFIVVGVMLLVIELLASESESRDETRAAQSES